LILFILSLRQPGYPQHFRGSAAFRHPVARVLALSEVGCTLVPATCLYLSVKRFAASDHLLFLFFLSLLTFSEKKAQTKHNKLPIRAFCYLIIRSAKYPTLFYFFRISSNFSTPPTLPWENFGYILIRELLQFYEEQVKLS
jgi:hypothetical protein